MTYEAFTSQWTDTKTKALTDIPCVSFRHRVDVICVCVDTGYDDVFRVCAWPETRRKKKQKTMNRDEVGVGSCKKLSWNIQIFKYLHEKTAKKKKNFNKSESFNSKSKPLKNII